MYKVFIYNKPIFFIDETDSPEIDEMSVFYCGNMKDRDQIMRSLSLAPRSIIIVGEKIKVLKELFFGEHQILEAAGGLVVNDKSEILFIYRNGFWDLPKGKIEKGEKKKIAAVREVEEECGITNPVIMEKLITTYHTYEMKGENIFKPTYWYAMKYTGDEALIPQTEEGITKVKWVGINNLEEQMNNTFEAIKDVVLKYQIK